MGYQITWIYNGFQLLKICIETQLWCEDEKDFHFSEGSMS